MGRIGSTMRSTAHITFHFVQGLPLWSSSLALVNYGRAIFGLIYDPFSHELFAAQEGLGATLNGKAISVSHKPGLKTAVLGTAVPPIVQAGDHEHARSLSLLGSVAPEVFVLRQMASASLQPAYVAAGRLDGYREVGEDTPDWLAGSLLLREAGATVTDLAGGSFGWDCDGILAAPQPVYDQLLAIIRKSERLSAIAIRS
jgi:myo-inositol-1(or 4)-monophosphatase